MLNPASQRVAFEDSVVFMCFDVGLRRVFLLRHLNRWRQSAPVDGSGSRMLKFRQCFLWNWRWSVCLSHTPPFWPSVRIYGRSQRRLCNLLLNGSCTMQMKWQMYVSFSWSIPGFFHAQWLRGALWERLREGGDEGSGRASRAQKCRPQKNRRPEREPCLLWMQSKESPSDNGSFSVPVNDPLTDGKETVLCPRAIAVPKKERFLLY